MSEEEKQVAYVREVTLVYKRSRGLKMEIDGGRVRCSRDIVPLVRKIIPDTPQERFVAFALDAKNQPIAYSVLGIGGLTQCPVAPADVVRFLILATASGAVFAHNHPSGDASPSPEDTTLTERLMQSCRLVGIKMLDHVIVSRDGHFSYLDAGLIPRPSDDEDSEAKTS